MNSDYRKGSHASIGSSSSAIEPERAGIADSFFEESRDLLCVLGLSDFDDNTDDGEIGMRQWRIQRVNKAWKTMLSYEKSDVIGRPLTALLHPDDSLREDDFMNGCSQVRFRAKDGSYHWICWAGTLSTSLHQRIFASGRNTTALKRQEEYLVASERRLQESIQIAKIGQWDLDLVQNKLKWSSEIYRLFQVDPDKFGASYEAFLAAIHPDDRNDVNQAYKEHLSTKQPYEIIHRLQYPDNTTKWVIESCRSEFDKDGNPLYSIGTVQDITEQKQAQEDLRLAKEKAEKADSLKSAFLANMSHDIRTPMNAVIGFTELMLTETACLKQEHREYLQTIHNSGKLLLALLNDILDISKIEAGQLQIENKSFSLHDVLKKVESNAKGILSRTAHNIELRNSSSPFCMFEQGNSQDSQNGIRPLFYPGATDMIVGDPNRLQQVLNNLLSNAIKFTESGHVEYTVKLLACANGPMLEFRVTDTGIGIPINMQQHVFEPFRQAHISSTIKGIGHVGGTGLGLAIARKLVEKMGGYISLESSVETWNHGSTFRFTIPYIPAKTKEQRPGQTTAVSKSAGGPQTDALPQLTGKVLIVDDNRVNLKLAERFVTRMGCQVEFADNGEVAVRKYTESPSDYGVILMDKWMPVMDGIEAMQAIRKLEKKAEEVEDHPGTTSSFAPAPAPEGTHSKKEKRRKIPIIAFTASAMAGDRDHCLEAGFDGYITKPLNRVELHKILATFLSIKQ